jgi:molybdenum cofactor cytidylyltransferase
MTEPVNEPVTGPVQIVAIVLAGGASRRFGSDNKLLTDVGGRPLVVRVIEAVEAGGIERIVVVTGHQPDRIAEVVARRGRRITYNERHARGMGTSVAAGVKALDDDVDGVLIVPGDMPAVDGALVQILCERFVQEGCNSIVHPVLDGGRQGNPVVWPRRLFVDLRKLSGEPGAKRLIVREGAAVVQVPIAGDKAAVDIDTAEDLARYTADPEV